MLVTQRSAHDGCRYFETLQLPLGLGPARRVAADGDDLIQGRDSDELAFQDVRPPFGLAHLEFGAAADHGGAVADELFQHALECQQLRPTIYQSQENDADRFLQWRKLVELIEDQVRIGVTLEVNNQAHRLAVAGAGFIADIADAFYLFFLDEIADSGGQAVARLLIGHLGDDDLRLTVLLADVGTGAEGDLAAAGGVAIENALPATDDAASREVGTRNDFQQLLQGHIRLVDDFDSGIAHFAQVMRRNIGGHAHGNALGTVDQQVRELAGQDQRLAMLAVVAIDEIDGVGFEIGKHLGADRRQPRLGITGSSGRQAGDGAEIALRMHQAITHVPILGHAYQGRIDRLIAVRMVALHRLADDAGALTGRSGGAESQVIHRHQDASLRRFESIAHIGQGPTDDDAHSVGEIAVLQFVGDVERVVTIAIAAWLRRNVARRLCRGVRGGRNVIWQGQYPP